MTQCAFDHILVGIDFSPSSLHALETVRQRFGGSKVTLVHVTEVSAPIGDPVTGFTPYDPALGRRSQADDMERLQQLAREDEACLSFVGDPVNIMLKLAREQSADLIVVGTHARGAIEHFFLGSTAEKMVSRSQVPVLTVRLPSV